MTLSDAGKERSRVEVELVCFIHKGPARVPQKPKIVVQKDGAPPPHEFIYTAFVEYCYATDFC